MRVAIIRDDNTVYVEGQPQPVDCSALPANVHAVQWDGLAGFIEFASVCCPTCSGVSKKPNEGFTDFGPYAAYVTAWDAANAAG